MEIATSKEVTEEEKKIIAQEILKMLEESFKMADNHTRELMKKINEVNGEKWKGQNYCETTKE